MGQKMGVLNTFNWSNLSPEDIAEYISFDRNNIDWKVEPEQSQSMYVKQAEGVAGLCRLLERYSIAILADEVGMGKTMQAFGVMVTLWKRQPNARVLVFAPRREVAQNWAVEYNEFQDKHLKPSSDLKIPEKAELIDRLDSKVNSISLEDLKVGQPQLVVAKITSLSYLNVAKSESEIKPEEYAKKAHALDKIMESFDFIIIDEAHYLRNVNGDSIRVQVANTLFKAIRNNTYVLLMSATPNHSRPDDIVNILSYFKWRNKELADTSEDILQQLTIRRLRRLADKTKYQYRKEHGLPAVFENDQNELFFALYQKCLVEEGIKRNNSKGQAFWKYLEGTDFDPDSLMTDINENTLSSENNVDKMHSDYYRAEDHDILLNILKKYQSTFYPALPSNPKYLKTIAVLTENIQNQEMAHKALVFVRRIPSASEITRQVIYEYDLVLWRMIRKTLRLKDDKRMPKDRKQFEKWILQQKNIPAIERNEEDKEEIIEAIDLTESEHEPKQKSLVLSWFKQEKKSNTSTHASRFVRRFYSKGGFVDFFDLDAHKSIWTLLKTDTRWRDVVNRFEYSKLEMEAFASLIQKAALHSSIGVIELYCSYLESDGSYNSFYAHIEKCFHKKKDICQPFTLKERIIEMLEHFEIFYSKVLGLKKENIGNEQWKMFNNSQPAYGYIGGTRNKTVLQTFNSPFFPDIITATSVLQEGVNLQYFCQKIYHYGTAWSPGDDEQRIGRIDRMFGLVEKKLKNNAPDALLDIYYPYLDGTHDANVLADFLNKKRKSEIEIDRAKVLKSKDISNILDGVPGKIKYLLHEPSNENVWEDPFPYNVKS